MLQNMGQYIIDHADDFIPKEKPYPREQNIVIELSVDFEIPHINVTLSSRYNAHETLKGVKWDSYTPRSGVPSY